MIHGVSRYLRRKGSMHCWRDLCQESSISGLSTAWRNRGPCYPLVVVCVKPYPGRSSTWPFQQSAIQLTNSMLDRGGHLLVSVHWSDSRQNWRFFWRHTVTRTCQLSFYNLSIVFSSIIRIWPSYYMGSSIHISSPSINQSVMYPHLDDIKVDMTGALTERPPTERRSDILTHTERPLDA
jgi:hypothetical protein